MGSHTTTGHSERSQADRTAAAASPAVARPCTIALVFAEPQTAEHNQFSRVAFELRRTLDSAARGGECTAHDNAPDSGPPSARTLLLAPRALHDSAEDILIHFVDPGRQNAELDKLIRLALAWRVNLLPIYLPKGAKPRLGSSISFETLARAGEDERVALVQWRSLALRYRHARRQGPSATAPVEVERGAGQAELASEILALPAGSELVRNSELSVYAVRAEQIPLMLHEIGRQRELAFRAAGEGSGRSLDLDRHDADYVHLFAYHRARQELVGAYRLGLVDELIQAGGIRALYTSSLFEYAPELFSQLGPTLELGRSFICPSYQKTSRALLWLWKGIARFVAERPKYRTLLGPVSVSAAYRDFSRELMVNVLSSAAHRHPLHRQVRPLNPFCGRSFGSGALGDPTPLLNNTEELSAVVSEAEPDRKGLPVMVREYLKLGGKFLAFNLDPDFTDVVDGLVVVDLLQTNRRLLEFYMGDRIRAFLNVHCQAASA